MALLPGNRDDAVKQRSRDAASTVISVGRDEGNATGCEPGRGHEQGSRIHHTAAYQLVALKGAAQVSQLEAWNLRHKAPQPVELTLRLSLRPERSDTEPEIDVNLGIRPR